MNNMEDSGIDSGDHNVEHISKVRFPTSESSSSVESRSSPARPAPSLQPLTSKQLHKRLEARIEHAKRLHREFNNQPATALIPIQRLSIPKGAKDQQRQPLVQWDTDDSEEDIVNFFPLNRKEARVHHELTDTFSIEEMSISGDEEDEDDLHLVPPQPVYKKFSCCSFTLCVIL